MRKILCKLGYNNWESSYEDFRINFVLPKGFSHLQSSFPSKLLSYKVRICRGCYKKQRRDISKWTDCDLNRQECRDKLLTDLDI